MRKSGSVWLPHNDAERMFEGETVLEDALRDLAMALFMGMGDEEGAKKVAKRFHLTGKFGAPTEVKITIEAAL